MRRLLFLILLTTLPSFAGITYTAQTRTTLGDEKGAGEFRVRGWVSGNHARMEFLKSDLPELEAGTYLVSSDGGNTVFLVNPKAKTYERWDVNGMVSNMADVMRSLRGQMHVRFEEPTVEKLLDEPGPLLQGMPTRHFRFRTSYKVVIDVSGSQTISTVTDEDIWTTDSIAEPGVRLFLNHRASSGDEQLDRIIDKEMSKVPGFPLRRITTTTTHTKNGTTKSRNEMEIVNVRKVSLADSFFRIPKGFTEVDPNAADVDRAYQRLEKDKEKKQ
jgi:hypothetical protein